MMTVSLPFVILHRLRSWWRFRKMISGHLWWRSVTLIIVYTDMTKDKMCGLIDPWQLEGGHVSVLDMPDPNQKPRSSGFTVVWYSTLWWWWWKVWWFDHTEDSNRLSGMCHQDEELRTPVSKDESKQQVMYEEHVKNKQDHYHCKVKKEWRRRRTASIEGQSQKKIFQKHWGVWFKIGRAQLFVSEFDCIDRLRFIHQHWSSLVRHCSGFIALFLNKLFYASSPSLLWKSCRPLLFPSGSTLWMVLPPTIWGWIRTSSWTLLKIVRRWWLKVILDAKCLWSSRTFFRIPSSMVCRWMTWRSIIMTGWFMRWCFYHFTRWSALILERFSCISTSKFVRGRGGITRAFSKRSLAKGCCETTHPESNRKHQEQVLQSQWCFLIIIY